MYKKVILFKSDIKSQANADFNRWVCNTEQRTSSQNHNYIKCILVTNGNKFHILPQFKIVDNNKGTVSKWSLLDGYDTT